MFAGRVINQGVHALALVLLELIPFSIGFAFAAEDSIRCEWVGREFKMNTIELWESRYPIDRTPGEFRNHLASHW